MDLRNKIFILYSSIAEKDTNLKPGLALVKGCKSTSECWNHMKRKHAKKRLSKEHK